MKRIILALGFSVLWTNSFAQENVDEEPLRASNPNAFYDRVDFSGNLLFMDRWGGFDIEAWEFYLNADLSLSEKFRMRFSLPFSNYTYDNNGSLFEGPNLDFDLKAHGAYGKLKSGVLSAGITSPLNRDNAFQFADNYGAIYELRAGYQAELALNDKISLYPRFSVYQRNGINNTTYIFDFGDSTYTPPSLYRSGYRFGLTGSYDFADNQFIQLSTDFDISSYEYREGDIADWQMSDNSIVEMTLNLRYQYALNPRAQVYANLKYNQAVSAYDDFGVNRVRFIHFGLGYNYLID